VCYGPVYSSHGELPHLCNAEECGVLTFGYNSLKLLGGHAVKIVGNNGFDSYLPT